MSGTFFYSVVIEWDGNRPPTLWYNRLHRMGMFVRGNKEMSPLARRNERQTAKGIVHQEGALLFESESEARIIAHLASECGAKAITLGQLETLELNMTAEDEHQLDRIQATLGKRGRPEPAKGWVITCHDEAHSYYYEGRRPIQCKRCGSMHFGLREGEQARVRMTGKTLTERWLNTRFFSGDWEEAIIVADDDTSTDAIATPVDPLSIYTEPRQSTDIVLKSTLLRQIEKALAAGHITETEGLHLLDCAFHSLRRTTEKRLNERIKGVTAWFKRGGEQNGLLLTVKADDVDALDIWSMDTAAFRLPVLEH